jgi:hypothetical protein
VHRLDTFPNNEIIQQYRAVFSGRYGATVLKHILFELGTFLEIAENAEDTALKNYGTRLLKILGGGEVGEYSLEQFTKRLMKQPLPKENKEE